MLKGINQSMINRSIAGGGNCKRGGFNGNGVDGGKIMATITVYSFDDDEGKEVLGVKKEEAERLFNRILSVDPEKYMFYRIRTQYSNIENELIAITTFPCDYVYTKYIKDGVLTQYCGVTNESASFDVTVMRKNGTIDYSKSTIKPAHEILDTLPGTVEDEHTYEYTFYYRER